MDLDTLHGDWRPFKEKVQRKEVAQLADLPKVSSLSVTNEIELWSMEIGVYKFVFCLKLVGQAMVDNPS